MLVKFEIRGMEYHCKAAGRCGIPKVADFSTSGTEMSGMFIVVRGRTDHIHYTSRDHTGLLSLTNEHSF